MSETTVLIAGAGIGGLTTALTLHRRGIPTLVVERARELRPLGVGINLLPHAVRELDALGLTGAVAAAAIAPRAIGYFDSTGTELFREPRGVDGGYRHPQLSVHRGLLQMILLDAVRDRLGGDAVTTAAALRSFTRDGARIVAHTDSGDVTADVLVGADGIDSAVRTALHPVGDPLLWSGVRMFRGAAARPAFLDGRTMAIVKGDNGIDLIAYAIGEHLVNWVLQVPAGDPGVLRGGAGWNRPADPAAVAGLVGHWRVDWLDVAEMVGTTAEVFEYPMVDRDPLPHWGDGRVTLLGDAAHPMYPVGANGGSQAILDARVLADELAAGDTERALRRYEDQRRPQTADVVAANRRMLCEGTTFRPDKLARVTARYRSDTHADRRRA
ncbi:FAD-dependent monooxygenase [Mycobacterium sp. NPDC050551]|uniref:FAD-dependent monooxygenase n=1 Tax=Mycobacterium sp. NPDC050551 TaxID=3155407 RepID=UPI003433B82D